MATRKRKEYAIKLVEKAHVARHGKINAVFRERDALSMLSNHDFTI